MNNNKKRRDKKISVCMAVYNGEKYITEQLNSILSQITLMDEIIIINDKSTDSSISIVESYNDVRIKIFHNNSNIGAQRSFERALEFATGDIIFFSDQDDIWIDGKVNIFLNVFNKTNCSAIVSNAKLI